MGNRVLGNGETGSDQVVEILEENPELASLPVKKGKKKADEKTNGKSKLLQITPPKFEILTLRIVGTAPLVQHRFGEKARKMIQETQEAGSQAKKGRKRDPKDFEACYQEARHIAGFNVDGSPVDEAWDGIHAGGFRKAMVDACSICGFHMTKGKKTLFVNADGYAKDGTTPLVRIVKGEPRMSILPVRNSSGVVDLRSRPMWSPGWEAILRIRYDADMFSAEDVLNLVARVGMQCGIGEGRANSKDSVGCDWGFFEVVAGEQPA